MNRITRALVLANLAFVGFTCFTFCTKDNSLQTEALGQNILPEDRAATCNLSFVSDVSLDVCGTRSNSNTCVFGQPGSESGSSGAYTLPSNGLIVFANNNGVMANVDVVCNGVTYQLDIPAGDANYVYLNRNCSLSIAY